VLVRLAESFYDKQRIVEELVLESMKKGSFWERPLHVDSGLEAGSTYLPRLEWPTLVEEPDSWNDGFQLQAFGMARGETVAGFRQ
jgi:hypothetical protein